MQKFPRYLCLSDHILHNLHDCTLNKKLNKLQERALRVVNNVKCSIFYQLLEKDKSVIIYTRNLQDLATEIFDVKIGISPA